jgi:hypothetical protein
LEWDRFGDIIDVNVEGDGSALGDEEPAVELGLEGRQ